MHIVFSEELIQKRVREMGGQISRDYGGEVVHVIGILENGFVFLADLVRHLNCPILCHFLKMDTLDTQESGHQPRRNIAYGSIPEVAGKNVLLVDVLVESGITLDHLIQQLLVKNPKSVRTAALVDREDRRKVALHLTYGGFSWDGGLLVGYGLEKEGLYRNLPYIASPESDSPRAGAASKATEEGVGKGKTEAG